MAKTFSGKQVVKILEKYFNFATVSQKGSHIKMQKLVEGRTVTTVVPNHKELLQGTLKGVLDLAEIEKKDFLKAVK
jgi:predicted RNA binding protein YcfA (HicA-like mRNA interferase family)